MSPAERLALGRGLAAYFARWGLRRHLASLREWWGGRGAWSDDFVRQWAAWARVEGYGTLPLLTDARRCPRCPVGAGCWRVRTSLPDGCSMWCDACAGEWLVLDSAVMASPAAVTSLATASA